MKPPFLDRTLPLLLTAALAAGFLATASASETLTLEPDRSGVEFRLDTTFHEVHGTMKIKEGSIAFDPETGAASGEVVVDARSADSGHAKRDKKMHKVVLESERFPEIVFHPRRFEGRLEPGNESHLRILGTMEIHGAEHEVAMPAVVLADGKTVTGSAELAVPYVDWGMKDPSVMMFRCRKSVDLTLHFEGHVAMATAEARDPQTEGAVVRGTH